MEHIEELLSKIEEPHLAQKLREIFAELLRSALTDSLTGLYNRRYFDTKLPKELEHAKRENTPLSILFIDIDNFKAVNDQLGHPMGDQVLEHVATLMKQNLRQMDLLTRFGGEEFVAILPNSNEKQSTVIAERLRKAIAEATFFGQKLTVSCGIATYPTHAKDATTLILLADQAMYSAKTASKNKVMIAGQFKTGKRATLGYLPKEEQPASIWVDGRFYPVSSWRQVSEEPPCYLAQSDRELLFLQRRKGGWFVME